MGAGLGLCFKNNAEFLLHILKNTENNAELKVLDVESIVIEHIQVNNYLRRAVELRVHGLINPHMNGLCQTEMIFTENKLFLS